MKRFTRFSSFALALALFALSACGGPKATPTSESDLAYTQIWETVEAGKTQTAAFVSPTPEFTSTPEITNTPEPTNTPLVTSTSEGPQPSITPAPTNTLVHLSTQTTCDNMQFVSDVTIPDGSEVPANTTFVKTWRFKNLGPCTWNEKYAVVYGYSSTGKNWTNTSSVSFGKTVDVNGTIDVSAEMDAPAEKGSYAAWFRLANDKGYPFGPFFWVSINVP